MLPTITSGKKELQHNSSLLQADIFDNDYVDIKKFNIGVHEVIIPNGQKITWEDHKNNLILVILNGSLTVDNNTYLKETTIVAPAGKKTILTAGKDVALHAILVIREAPKKLDNIIVSKHDSKEWYPVVENNEVHLYLKDILTADEIGGCVFIIDYPSDHVSEWHDHEFSHAVYVLEGIFCNQAQQDKTENYYAPGSFIFSPKGQIMRHGSAKGQHCKGVFITEKPFDLRYLSDNEINDLNLQKYNTK